MFDGIIELSQANPDYQKLMFSQHKLLIMPSLQTITRLHTVILSKLGCKPILPLREKLNITNLLNSDWVSNLTASSHLILSQACI